MTGCSTTTTPPKEGESATTQNANEKVELEFFQQKSENIELFNQIIAKFNEKYPNITVNQVSMPDAAKVLVTRVSTNDVPDICLIYPTQTLYKDMMKEDIFMDLTGDPLLDRVQPKIVDMIKYDGKDYSIPMTLNAYGVFYNVDLFAQNNIAVPKTYDEFLQACDKLKAAGITPIAFFDKDTGALGQQFERLMAGSVDKDIVALTEKVAKGETTFTKDDSMGQMAELILKLREYGAPDTMGIGNEQAIADFANGKSAMYLSGTWALASIQKANPNIKVDTFAFPDIHGGQTLTCGTIDTAFALSATTTNSEAAKTFISFLLSPEIAQMYCDQDRNPNIVKDIQYNVKELEPINTLINDGNFVLIPSSFWPAGYRDEIQVILQQLILDKDIDQFLKKATDITVAKYTETN